MAKLQRVSALAGHIVPGDYGAMRDGRSGVVLGELRPSAIAQINGATIDDISHVLSDFRLIPKPGTNRASINETTSLIWNGPGKWFVVSGDREPQELIASLSTLLRATNATVTDLSHARTVVRVEGSRAADILVKGCSADVEAMTTNDTMTTMVGALSAIIHCLQTGEVYDVYVFRSFGLSFWHWVTDAALEYGYTVKP